MAARHPHKCKRWSLWDSFLQFDPHEGLFLVPPSPWPVPGMGLHVSGSNLWMSSDDTWNNQTVWADGACLVSRGTEVTGGINLLHVPIMPPTGEDALVQLPGEYHGMPRNAPERQDIEFMIQFCDHFPA